MCPTKLCEVSPKDFGELSRQLPKRREPIAQILLGAHRIREPHTFNAWAAAVRDVTTVHG